MTSWLACQRVTSAFGVLMSKAIIDQERSMTIMMSSPSVSRSISLFAVRGPAKATMRSAAVSRRRKRRRRPLCSRTGRPMPSSNVVSGYVSAAACPTRPRSHE